MYSHSAPWPAWTTNVGTAHDAAPERWARYVETSPLMLVPAGASKRKRFSWWLPVE